MTEENKASNNPLEHILVIGNDKLSCSLVACLAVGTTQVTWLTSQVDQGKEELQNHTENLEKNNWPPINKVLVTNEWPVLIPFHLVCISNQTPIVDTRNYITRIEKANAETIIAIGTAGLPLSDYQVESQRPGNIVGVNWAVPVHTTYFMEIIANEKTRRAVSDILMHAGEKKWKKDPYLVTGEFSIQERMMSALMREALFLVGNGYALPSDIDTSCRNDGGSYLPFAGVFRYMDLMGTYLYGVVMSKLNEELSTDNSVLDMLDEMVDEGRIGVEASEGFYSYSPEEVRKLEQKMNAFSYDIRQLMAKYKVVNGS